MTDPFTPPPLRDVEVGLKKGKMKKRKGKIRIHNEFLNDIDGHKEHLFMLFSTFIPIDIITSLSIGYSTYYGVSYDFDEIDEGVEIPLYDAIFTYNTEGDDFTLSFKRL